MQLGENTEQVGIQQPVFKKVPADEKQQKDFQKD